MGHPSAPLRCMSRTVSRKRSESTSSSRSASSSSVVRPNPGHFPNAVLVAQQVRHLAVEDLPGELPRLFQHAPSVLGVGVVAEISALVDETLAARIDHDPEGVAVLLEAVADAEIAEIRRVAIPGDGMASGPVAPGHRADVHRHPDAVAGVLSRPAHFRKLPAWTQVPCAPLRVGLETARGENDRAGSHRVIDVVLPDDDAGYRTGFFHKLYWRGHRTGCRFQAVDRRR